MPAGNRPAKRVLNRWCDDLDKGVLLCIQYSCAEAGLKIPWGRVAALMGPTFTEGSIVQHLAKLRLLMIRAGIPVPPAVKRGMVTKEPSKIYTTTANNVKLEEVPPMFPDARNVKEEGDGEDKGSIYDKPKRVRVKKEVPAVTEAEGTPIKKELKPKGKGKGKAKGRRQYTNDEDDNEPMPDLYDSDDEYPAPRKRRNNNSKSKMREAFAEASMATPQEATPSFVSPAIPEKPNTNKDVAIKVEEEELTGPPRRTRGIKRDYSVMVGGSEDEAEVDEEVLPPYMEEDFKDTHGNIDSNDGDENAQSGSIDDDMDDASSEVSAVALPHQQAFYSNGTHVADQPYGQAIPTFDIRSDMATCPAFNTPSAGGYGLHGHMGVGTADCYSVPELGYSDAAVMSTMTQAYTTSQPRRLSLYHSSADSTRNNSIVANMMYQTLPSMSDGEFLTAHTGFGHTTGDVINEADMMNSTANDDIFFGDSGFLVDDA
ncbi:hypothetical protein AYL99_08523 [Fonsecaea erecta]|uniref:Uncharacterized protein n=1 Tax=Fonsecaea erecta TaxID=1367422 RepID=A0A178ZFE6_9EURO|nr:hypothetical protein AYL99_08523 [Fonsecaea erecta]OAP57785.1 hypothetical protein AYL99_08523 [Fonsecaea erecta]